jgi:hypothetical protein
LESAPDDFAGSGLTPDEIAALRTLATASVHGAIHLHREALGAFDDADIIAELTRCAVSDATSAEVVLGSGSAFVGLRNRFVLGQFCVQPLGRATRRTPGKPRLIANTGRVCASGQAGRVVAAGQRPHHQPS